MSVLGSLINNGNNGKTVTCLSFIFPFSDKKDISCDIHQQDVHLN